MDRIGELIRALDDEAVVARSATAKVTHTCKICGNPANFFRSPFAELEYSISSICQACQDYFFLEGDGRRGRADIEKKGDRFA